MGHKGGLNEGGFDEFFEDGVGHLEIFIAFLNFCPQFGGLESSLLRRELKPVVPCFFANEGFVGDGFPGRGQINGTGDLSISVLMLDDQSPQNLFRHMGDHSLNQVHHALVIPIGLIGFQHGEFRIVPS